MITEKNKADLLRAFEHEMEKLQDVDLDYFNDLDEAKEEIMQGMHDSLESIQA